MRTARTLTTIVAAATLSLAAAVPATAQQPVEKHRSCAAFGAGWASAPPGAVGAFLSAYAPAGELGSVATLLHLEKAGDVLPDGNDVSCEPFE